VAVSFLAAGAQTENATALTTLALPYPAGMTSAVTNLPTLPAGWTQVFRNSANAGAGTPSMMVAIKQATGSESGSLNVTYSSSTAIGQIQAFNGVDLTTPQDVAASVIDTGVASASSIVPAMTLTKGGTGLVYFGAQNSTANTATPPSTPSAFTETADRTGGGARSGTMGYLIRGSSGTTGTMTITWSGSARNMAVVLALRPASGAGAFFSMF
jgi:hypothetical protein